MSGIAFSCRAAGIRACSRVRPGAYLLALAFLLLALSAGGSPAWAAKHTAREIIKAKGCYGCHIIPGIPEAVGKIGPPLTDFGKRRRIAGGLLKNTPENLRTWLKNPKDVKTTMMPNAGLTEEEITILIEFLATL